MQYRLSKLGSDAHGSNEDAGDVGVAINGRLPNFCR